MTELTRKKNTGGAWETVIDTGGDSLPDWWTVDSTTDEKSVTFAGSVLISPSSPDAPNPLKVVGAAGSGAAFSTLFELWSDTARILAIDAGGDCLLELRPGGSEFRVSGPGGVGQLFKIKDDGTMGFFGTATAAQQTLDPATCTAEDIANALIASKFMAAA